MKYALISHIAKSLNYPQNGVDCLLNKHDIKPVGNYGFANVYDVDELVVKLEIKLVEYLTEEEAKCVTPLNRPLSSKNSDKAMNDE